MERWGISPDRTGDHLFRGSRTKRFLGADDVLDWDAAADEDEHEGDALGFLLDGGWHAVTVNEGGGRSGGMTSHRGVLQGHEHVDSDALQALVENELGFTLEQVRSVYRQGRLSAESRELRGRIDARVLALSQAGGNVAALGRVLGFHVNASGACEALNNALERARKESLS